jgi:hypothetical protein
MTTKAKDGRFFDLATGKHKFIVGGLIENASEVAGMIRSNGWMTEAASQAVINSIRSSDPKHVRNGFYVLNEIAQEGENWREIQGYFDYGVNNKKTLESVVITWRRLLASHGTDTVDPTGLGDPMESAGVGLLWNAKIMRNAAEAIGRLIDAKPLPPVTTEEWKEMVVELRQPDEDSLSKKITDEVVGIWKKSPLVDVVGWDPQFLGDENEPISRLFLSTVKDSFEETYSSLRRLGTPLAPDDAYNEAIKQALVDTKRNFNLVRWGDELRMVPISGGVGGHRLPEYLHYSKNMMDMLSNDLKKTLEKEGNTDDEVEDIMDSVYPHPHTRSEPGAMGWVFVDTATNLALTNKAGEMLIWRPGSSQTTALENIAKERAAMELRAEAHESGKPFVPLDSSAAAFLQLAR